MDTIERYIEPYLLGRERFIAAASPHVLLLKSKETRFARDAFRFQTRVSGEAAEQAKPVAAQLVQDHQRLRDAGLKLRSIAYQYYFVEVKKRLDSYCSRVFVGRTEQCDIVIPDGRISKLHAYFELGEGPIQVADAGSRNGCRVNGRALVKQCPTALADGDCLEIGPFAFCLLSSKLVYEEIHRMLEPISVHDGVAP
jgi:hypothetical protein